MNFEKARFNMVEQQIRPWQVLDTGVLQILSSIQRELFLPSQWASIAYSDTEIALGHDEYMLPPRIDARLMHDLHLQGNETVLEIGTGSGYLTALLAAKSKRVISFEQHDDLAQRAKSNLKKAGFHHVDIRVSDGSQGSIQDGPYDAIVLTGSVDEVPEKLLSQLKAGGQLIAIVGDEPVMQTTLFKRISDQQWNHKVLWDTLAPRLHGFEEHSQFSF
ncbi:MAG: protein-L-isoaspartate O-methyltransferase family protein [Burkholderiaceae bacterium]